MCGLNSLFVILMAVQWVHQIASLGTSCYRGLDRSPQTVFWEENIKHDEISAFNSDPSNYKVFRNVKDFGAKGDGTTDDTAAINRANAEGNRCGQGCDSSTLTPAIVYFPPGKYVVSSPLVQYYFTQFVGDPNDLPTLIMASNFTGSIGLIDSDPYDANGNYWANQNNFYRQIRNFIIDTRRMPASANAIGIHWQVAQATSLTNIHFKLSKESGTQHQGIYMENGSGGFMSDLTFEGGLNALSVGNQQFTSRNITITDAETAIQLNFDWGWTFKNINIRNCKIGIDITSGGSTGQADYSLLLMDSHISNTPVGVLTGTSPTSTPPGSGALILDNVRLTNVNKAVASPSGDVVLAGGTKTIRSWGQGQVYDSTGKFHFNQGPLPASVKPAVLLDSKNPNKIFFEKKKPTYTDVAMADFVSVHWEGAKGDGKTDDTKAIASSFAKYAGCKVIYFPTGTYLVSDTILVPAGSRVIGEVWPTISATGRAFSDINNPKPVFKIGNPGDRGVAELTELVFSTHGRAPGAILVQINMRDPPHVQGAVGLWDVHFRVGGAKGTEIQDYDCDKNDPITKPECFGAFMLLHIARTGSAYLENVWGWVADHDLDVDGDPQINVYNGRGILSESSKGPVWMYGTSFEHSVLYQYNIAKSKNVIMAMIQTETPYYQSNPSAPIPFTTKNKYHDPDFGQCSANSITCPMAWGLRVVKSLNIFVYGAGLYSFFNNYSADCLGGQHCQDYITSIEHSPCKIYIYNLNTIGSDSMLSFNGKSLVNQSDNRASFPSTIAAFLETNQFGHNLKCKYETDDEEEDAIGIDSIESWIQQILDSLNIDDGDGDGDGDEFDDFE